MLGGIGSGKSTVGRMFEAEGALLLDADRIVHNLFSRANIRKRLRARWGSRVILPDGTVDRKALGAIVFGNRRELAALTAIVHPPVCAEIRRRVRSARGVPAIVIEAAMLLESGLGPLCDVLVFIHAPRATREKRVRTTRFWAPGDLARRERFQKSLILKRKMSDYYIDNRGPIGRVLRQLRKVLGQILHVDGCSTPVSLHASSHPLRS
ncbi:MAG: dephospho-CoA kinase [Planctomycetota bacterium]